MIADRKDFCGPVKEGKTKGGISATLVLIGAPSRSRTGTSFRTTDFKSGVSTNFTIRAMLSMSASGKAESLWRQEVGIYTSPPHEASAKSFKMGRKCNLQENRKISRNQRPTAWTLRWIEGRLEPFATNLRTATKKLFSAA